MRWKTNAFEIFKIYLISTWHKLNSFLKCRSLSICWFFSICSNSFLEKNLIFQISEHNSLKIIVWMHIQYYFISIYHSRRACVGTSANWLSDRLIPYGNYNSSIQWFIHAKCYFFVLQKKCHFTVIYLHFCLVCQFPK